jgi:voltage-gated potassium channel
MAQTPPTAPRRTGLDLGIDARFASVPLPKARQVERQWRWPTVIVLLCTIPSFYFELLYPTPPLFPVLSYVTAALVMAAAVLHVGWHSGDLKAHVRANRFDLLLGVGLLMASMAPPSASSTPALVLRLIVGFFTLARMFWAAHYVITRGGTLYRLIVALLVLLLCGLGFWWLEPTTPTLFDALWLAFTTAATVGYGDFVPTTPASKIFAVFVVFLGVGAVTLVTAAIASAWVETGERHIEREILHDMRQQLASVHAELLSLREEVRAGRPPDDAGAPSEGEPVRLQGEQAVEDQ